MIKRDKTTPDSFPKVPGKYGEDVIFKARGSSMFAYRNNTQRIRYIKDKAMQYCCVLIFLSCYALKGFIM